MRLWSRYLRFLWEEEAASVAPVARATGPPGEISGVPAFLRRATRWSVMAVVGATLIGQIIGVQMIAPAAADEDFPNTTACYVKECSTDCSKVLKACLLDAIRNHTSTNACTPAFNSCLNGCVRPCFP